MKSDPRLIYGLIACLLLAGAPHADHLPAWVSLTGLALLSWRALLCYRGKALPSRRLLMLITLACVAGIVLNLHALFGREAGVTLLILLGSLKMLELRETRDAMILLYLCCFVSITLFFYTQTIPAALLMLGELFLVVTTWLQVQAENLDLRARARMASIILLQAAPLALLMFVFFPRIQGPLWGMPQDAYGSSGLSDTMTPGSLSRLSQSEAVAFRVTFDGAVPERERLYWRGPVLWDFDGRKWSQGRSPVSGPSHLERAAQPVHYTITLEPHNKRWLFALDIPVHISTAAAYSPDFNLLSTTPVNTRLRYDATSFTRYQANPDEAPQQLDRALALPPGYDPRARELAGLWRQQSHSAAEIVQTALAYFHRNGFTYTLEPPLLGRDSVDDFLFNTRQGFCEHYASSFVFLMRAAGIPARVVTGYQGGEYNALGGYYILRQSDAHAWTEVWLPGRGWVRQDPTAAIAPARIQEGLGSAVSDSALLPFFMRNPPQFLSTLRMDLDALTNQWNQWVLGYDSEKQFALLNRFGLGTFDWQNLVTGMALSIAMVVALLAMLMLRQPRRQPIDAVQKLYLDFCHTLERHGIQRDAHEGPQDFSRRASAQLPQHATAIQEIVRQYLALRYRNRVTVAAISAFRHAVRRFKL